MASLLILLLLHLAATTTTAFASSTTTTLLPCASTPTIATCSAEIVSFSPCLPYTAIPPLKSASSVCVPCCRAFTAILASRNRSCLCSLLVEPPIFGFPLNSSVLFSLSSACPIAPRLKNSALFHNFTLQSFCSAVNAPSPMPSSGQEHQDRSNCISPTSGSAGAAGAAAGSVAGAAAGSVAGAAAGAAAVSEEPSSFQANVEPLSEGHSFPPPVPPRGFNFGTFQASSSTRIMRPWSSRTL